MMRLIRLRSAFYFCSMPSLFYLRATIYSLGLYLLAGCNSAGPLAKITSPKTPAYDTIPDSVRNYLQAGDLVFRRGNDPVSDLFASLNQRDQHFSHCGILVFYKGMWHVCHMINPSGVAADTANGIVMSLLDNFISPRENAAWALVRTNIGKVRSVRFADSAAMMSTRHLLFDTRFDLETDDALYCTEMVYKVLQPFLDSTYRIPLTIAESGRPYVAVDNLFGQDFTTTIVHIEYK